MLESYRSLALKWRPQDFSEVVNQQVSVTILRNALMKGTVFPAMAFYGPSGTGKCVAENTFVYTDFGTCQIKDLLNVGDLVTATEEGPSHSYCIYSGVKDTVEVTSSNGYRIEGTPQHRIRVVNSKGFIVWKQLGNIDVGDWLVLRKGAGVFGKDENLNLPGPFDSPSGKDLRDLEGLRGTIPEGKQRLSRQKVGERQVDIAFEYGVSQLQVSRLLRRKNINIGGPNGGRRGLPKTFNFPGVLTEDWAWLIGFTVGDGCFSKSSLHLTTHREFVPWVQHKIESVLGRKACVTEDKRSNAVSLMVSDKWFDLLWGKLGLRRKKSADKVIPYQVMRGSKAIVCRFLNGLFSADGYVVPNGQSVEIMLASEHMVRQIEALLLNLGVVGTFSKKWNAKYKTFYYKFYIPVDYVPVFIDLVGIDQPFRNKRLLKWSPPRNKTSLSTVPNLERFYGGNTVTRKVLPRIVSKHKILELHDNLRDFVYVKAVGVTNRSNRVYDLVVPRTKNFIANGFIAHNTSVARLYAKAVNCENFKGDICGECSSCKSFSAEGSLCYTEIDAASNGGVEDVHELVKRLRYEVPGVPYRVVAIDEAHMNSTPAWNAFLKTIEEPPPHVIFIFVTTEIRKVPEQVLGRCFSIPFKKISESEISDRLIKIAKAENINIGLDVINSVALRSEGKLRDAVTLLEQLWVMSNDGKVSEEALSLVGICGHDVYAKFIDLIFSGKVEEVIDLFRFWVNSMGPQDFLKGLEDYLHKLFLHKNGMPVNVQLPKAKVTWDLMVECIGKVWGMQDVVRNKYSQARVENLLARMVLRSRDAEQDGPVEKNPPPPQETDVQRSSILKGEYTSYGINR